MRRVVNTIEVCGRVLNIRFEQHKGLSGGFARIVDKGWNYLPALVVNPFGEKFTAGLGYVDEDIADLEVTGKTPAEAFARGVKKFWSKMLSRCKFVPGTNVLFSTGDYELDLDGPISGTVVGFIPHEVSPSRKDEYVIKTGKHTWHIYSRWVHLA